MTLGSGWKRETGGLGGGGGEHRAPKRMKPNPARAKPSTTMRRSSSVVEKPGLMKILGRGGLGTKSKNLGLICIIKQLFKGE